MVGRDRRRRARPAAVASTSGSTARRLASVVCMRKARDKYHLRRHMYIYVYIHVFIYTYIYIYIYYTDR